MPLISAHGKVRQMDFYEFKTRQGYIVKFEDSPKHHFGAVKTLCSGPEGPPLFGRDLFF